MAERAADAGAREPLDVDDAGALDEAEQRAWSVPQPLHGDRIDKVLAALAPEFSRSHLQSLVAAGHVRLDATPCLAASRKVAFGQRIEITLIPNAASRAFRPEPLPIDIVFEDAHLLVINKRAGWVVHPAAGNWSGTLLNALLAYHPGAADLPRAGLVHRLDKDTSGLLVVAKTLPAMTSLTRAIAAHDVQRTYRAIVHGEVAPAGFSIEAPIGRDPRVRVRMAVVATGKPARTDVRCVAVRETLSALECSLHTGRTHQIRVHLSARGHPLVADELYGGRTALGLERQALHAAALGFVHPVSGAVLDFQAPPPGDFDAAWRWFQI